MKEKTIVEQLNERIKKEDGRRTPYQNFIVIILAILGGCSSLIEMATPIFLCLIWVKLFGFYGLGTYLLYSIGFLATVFRAIKIGFLK